MEFRTIRQIRTVTAVLFASMVVLAACKDDNPSSPSGRRPSALVATAGSGQVAPVATTVAVTPQVTVRDAQGRAVAGVEVTFRIARGGGTATGTTAISNANGVASVGSWTLGPVAGGNELVATVSGAGSAVFLADAIAGMANSISVAAGLGQTAQVGNLLLVPPAVTVRDMNGNAVVGAAVVFAVTGGGGSITGASATTDLAGRASVGSWRMGSAPGQNTISVTVAGATPIVVSATAVAGVPSTMTASAGTNQSSSAALPVPTPPAVLVRDAAGNPVTGVGVSFVVESGGGSATGTLAITGTDGIARVGSWTLGNLLGANTLRATAPGLTPVVFNATAVAGIAASISITAGNGQTATVATAVSTAPAVRVLDASGNPLVGITVGFAAAVGSGSVVGGSVLTDANGIAQVGSWTLGTGAGANALTATVSGVAPVTFAATGTAGAAVLLEKIFGDNGREPVGTGTPAPTVVARDLFGNPVPNVTVNFAVTGGLGRSTGNTMVTGANGVARVATWTIGIVAGINTMSASAAGVPSETFTVIGIAGAPALLSIVAGNNQVGAAGTALPIHPLVLVTDVHGNPVSSVPISFAVTMGGGSIASIASTTVQNGTASSGAWTLGTLVGTNRMTASATLMGSLQTVEFTAVGVAGAPAMLIKVTGDGQSALIGSLLPIALSVKLVDGFGNVIPGATISYAVTAGGGSIPGSSAVTDLLGIATLGSWTIGGVAGANNITASIAGVTPAVFVATGFGPLVAVGGTGVGGTIRTSVDGLNWTERVSPFTSFGRAVAYNGSQWLAGADGAVTLARSTDAITWTAIPNPLTTYVGGLAWNGSLWVAVGSTGGGGTSIATSPDGITWTARVSPFSGAASFASSVVWNGSIWLAGGSASGGDPGFATSPDGITWTARPGPFTGQVNGVSWNGSLFVASGTGGTMIATSPDGITWTPRASPFGHFGQSASWNGSMWVAVGAFGVGTSIQTSPDGITWTARPSAFIEALSVTWTGTYWVAVGRNSAAVPITGTSLDGITWTTAPAGFSVLATAVGWTPF